MVYCLLRAILLRPFYPGVRVSLQVVPAYTLAILSLTLAVAPMLWYFFTHQLREAMEDLCNRNFWMLCIVLEGSSPTLTLSDIDAGLRNYNAFMGQYYHSWYNKPFVGASGGSGTINSGGRVPYRKDKGQRFEGQAPIDGAAVELYAPEPVPKYRQRGCDETVSQKKVAQKAPLNLAVKAIFKGVFFG